MDSFGAAEGSREALQGPDAPFSALFERAAVGVAQIDSRTGHFVRVNQAYCDLVGYTREEMRALDCQALTHPEDREADHRLIERLNASEIPDFTLEKRYRHKDGHTVWVSLTASALRPEGGAPDFRIAIVQDITERKRSEEERHQVIERISDAFVALDKTWHFTYVNERAGQMFGRRPEDLIGKHIWTEFPEGVGQPFHQAYERAMAEQQMVLLEDYAPPWDRWFENRIYPSPDGLTIYFHDISDRKRAEEALRQSEAGLAITLQSIGDAVIATDLQGRITRMNPAAERMTAWSLADALGRPLPEVFRILNTKTRELMIDPVRLVLDRGTVVGLANHTALLARDGRELQIADSAAPIRDAKGTLTGVVLVFSDVTEHYQAQEALRQSEERLRLAHRVAGVAFLQWDLRTDVIFLSQEACDLFGWDRQEGMAAAALIGQAPHPEDRELVRTHLEQAIQGVKEYNLDHRILRPDGTVRWVHAMADLVRDEDGRPLSLLGTMVDITARKQAEEEKANVQAQLQQSQKLESLGSLAGGVAHDMNNVLAAILGLASLQLELEPEDSRRRRAFETICKACNRGAELVKGLLAFSRKGLAEARPLDLNGLIREEVQLLGHTTLSRIQLRMELAPELRRIRGDAGALSHALMNLCVNALDAMPEGGQLTLRTRMEGSEVVLEVEDTGRGMTEDILGQALDPFFTTKAQGQGTGLGLSLVYSTMKAHGGRLNLASQYGRGTRVMLAFPVCEPPGTSSGAFGEGPACTPPKGLKVLLVDDDDLVMGALVPMLERLQCDITLARTGEKALTLLGQNLRPDVVILDLNMPGLGGAETLARLRALCPGLPVVLSTGKADQTAADLTRAFEGVSLLPKPYSFNQISHCLATLPSREA